MRFNTQIAVVTGGASGIGFAIAKRLVGEGARVKLLDINDSELRKSVSLLSSGDVDKFVCDVSDRSQVETIMKEIYSQEGRIDVLCNSAGIVAHRVGEDEGQSTWNRLNSVNLTSTYNCVTAAYPMMKQLGRGSVVNIASVSGIRGLQGIHWAYAASKGGVIALTQQMSIDLAADGIRVNAVSPGFVATPMNAERRKAGDDIPWLSRIPLRRYATADEIASVAVFLASSDASYVTGANIVVDGGLSAAIAPVVADTLKASPRADLDVSAE